MKPPLTNLKKFTRRRSARLVPTLFASLTLAVLAMFALSGVSADTWGKFGITEQSRLGQLLSQFAPQTFPSTRETAHGEAALKLLKERGQYESLHQALETARYRAHAVPQRAGEFLALNPAQALHSRFTPQGVEVRRHSEEQTPKLAMTLRGIGYGDRQLAVSPGTVTAQDQRIEIHRTVGEQSAITEWYVNRPNGLEQGFTLAAPPGGAGERQAGERLRLTLGLSGAWQAQASADGQAVEFSEPSGGGTLRYDHLVVRDAQGKTLPARMSLIQRELRLEVEDAGAVWPVTIDPTLAQQAYLKASNTGENDRFGASVAVSGDTVVVGASDEDSSTTGVNSTPNEAVPDSGAAYVFVRNAGVWTQQAYLKASNTGENDGFGTSVAVAGDTVVVGASAENSTSTGVNSSPNDSGFVVGAAYVFVRNAGVWTQQAYLKASNTGSFDQFGASVAVAGDTVVVGAVFEDSDTTGVNSTPNEGATESGAAYVFVRNAGVWTQQAYLKASNTGAGDLFGSVAVSGDTVVVGAYGERSSTTGVNSTPNELAPGAGAAYVFVRNAGVWTQQAYLKASNTGMNHLFGLSVAVGGDTVVAGAIGEGGSAGAAYVYVRSAGVWTQQAYLKASNAGGSDNFGQSVAVAGDTVVVGAFREDSSTTGVNSTPNEGAGNSGAAYVFGRSGTTWTQESYLKASNTGGADNFGISAAISGDTVVVGAYGEASNATGVNGNQNDNSAPGAGAAYVFAVSDAPTFTPAAAISRQQGSTAGAAVTVGTVADAQTAAGSLTVTQIAGGTATGITVIGITNTGGTITAVVTATCTAVGGTVRFQVSDGDLTGIGDLTVNVTANTAPTLTYGAASVNAGGPTSNSPTSATDNGSITGYAVQSLGSYTGTISVNASGLVSISNAVPPGVHTITIRATDNCGATTDATFSLTVTNTPPTITAQTGVTRQQGAGSSNSQIANVNDSESGANGVTVTVNGTASATVNGVTVSNISNSGGTVTADIVATCGASSASFTLTATDGHAATATATLNVSVTGITLSSLVNGLTFVPYSLTLTATGGTGSYTFSLVSGTLPPGLTLSGNVLSGTPTAAGASTFTIRADDDSNTCFGERVYTINIGSTGLMYYPLARPVRLLDTRPGASPNACFQPNAPITGGTTRTQPARGTCEGIVIPANATTITGHITTVQSGGGSLTLYPSDAPQPNVSNSNYLANEILNNAFTVGLGVNDGAFKLFVGTNTDVVIDVTGYYAPPGAGGLYFHPLPKPIRLLETRTGFSGCQTPGAPLQTATTRTQTGVLTCDGVTIPTGALALVGNATTTNSTGSGYLTLYPADATQPFASSSNFAAGVNRNAPFTVGLSLNGEFNIYTARTTDLVIDVMGYYSTEANDANGQGLLFNSLGAPLRLLDTRAGQPACYQPGAPMTGGTVYTQETQIACTNLTSAARGLVGNVSALNATANGYLTFWPSNATQPTVATSNYQTGRVFNRHFTVGLGNDVAFKRFAASSTDVIIDISGFFAP